MLNKVSDLSGPLLDLAVAMADGKHAIPHEWGNAGINDLGRCSIAKTSWDCARYFEPSKNWGHGGPIIERERIECQTVPEIGGVAPPPQRTWSAWGKMRNGVVSGHWVSKSIVCEGPTILVAAMRAFVASKFGDTVELP